MIFFFGGRKKITTKFQVFTQNSKEKQNYLEIIQFNAWRIWFGGGKIYYKKTQVLFKIPIKYQNYLKIYPI